MSLLSIYRGIMAVSNTTSLFYDNGWSYDVDIQAPNLSIVLNWHVKKRFGLFTINIIFGGKHTCFDVYPAFIIDSIMHTFPPYIALDILSQLYKVEYGYHLTDVNVYYE